MLIIWKIPCFYAILKWWILQIYSTKLRKSAKIKWFSGIFCRNPLGSRNLLTFNWTGKVNFYTSLQFFKWWVISLSFLSVSLLFSLSSISNDSICCFIVVRLELLILLWVKQKIRFNGFNSSLYQLSKCSLDSRYIKLLKV